MTLTFDFDLDLQSHPSEGPNTSSVLNSRQKQNLPRGSLRTVKITRVTFNKAQEVQGHRGLRLRRLIKPISITLSSSIAGLPPARELVRELLASWAKTCVCTSGACRGKFHYAVQLTTSSQAGLRPARELVAEQDSVVKYGLNRSATSRFELSRYRAGLLAGLRPASELDSVLAFGL